MWNYINTVNEYTHGKGTLTLKFKGYAPCHNSEEVIAEKGYDSELDLRNPTGSVFCAHGSGFNVPWNEVENYMHVKTELNLNNSQPQEEISIKSPQNIQKSNQRKVGIKNMHQGKQCRRKKQCHKTIDTCGQQMPQDKTAKGNLFCKGNQQH